MQTTKPKFKTIKKYVCGSSTYCAVSAMSKSNVVFLVECLAAPDENLFDFAVDAKDGIVHALALNLYKKLKYLDAYSAVYEVLIEEKHRLLHMGYTQTELEDFNVSVSVVSINDRNRLVLTACGTSNLLCTTLKSNSLIGYSVSNSQNFNSDFVIKDHDFPSNIKDVILLSKDAYTSAMNLPNKKRYNILTDEQNGLFENVPDKHYGVIFVRK